MSVKSTTSIPELIGGAIYTSTVLVLIGGAKKLYVSHVMVNSD
jgi:hypothetical protein